jgi:O-6-methylguanine DNA methyltransferase
MNLKEARAMVMALRSSAEAAPGALAGEVLAGVGLAHEWTEMDGPIGPLFVAWGPQGITAVERAGDPAGFESDYGLRHGRPLRRVPDMPTSMARQVARRLSGERTSGPPVDLSGLTAFEQAVLRATLAIPYGEVRPYAWLAREVGRPRAVRAVGSALAGNPVPFVIPCHRVVRTDGHIGEYGAGGPEAKRAVLGAEGVDTAALERLAASGTRFTGSDTTRIYCFPSCRHARRTSPAHEVRFRSPEEARSAGYRPCRVCRPLESSPFAA